jgi:hypothetical protein
MLDSERKVASKAKRGWSGGAGHSNCGFFAGKSVGGATQPARLATMSTQ